MVLAMQACTVAIGGHLGAVSGREGVKWRQGVRGRESGQWSLSKTTRPCQNWREREISTIRPCACSRGGVQERGGESGRVGFRAVCKGARGGLPTVGMLVWREE
jgi:hypothetical protein